MMLFVNNQTAGCFTVVAKNEKAKEFVASVINGDSNWNLQRDGWDALKKNGVLPTPHWARK